MQRFLILFFFVILSFQSVFAAETQKLRFGVLSFRPKDITMAQWLPLAKELEKNLTGYNVELLPMTYPELDQAAKTQQLDLVLTNPEHYILLKNIINVNAVATLITLDQGHPLMEFAGVIFTRANRADIQTLADLNGKKIAAPAEQSLGGYLMQRWELEKNNVEAKEYVFTGMPHDKVVDEVLTGNADAGFVRSGILESLEKVGKIQLGENSPIRVIAPHEFNVDEANHRIYSLHSTAHYPEWTFNVRKNLSPEISRKLSLILLNIKPDSDVAKAAGIAGFTAPADYTPVEVLMLRLRAHPDELKYFDFSDVVWRYRESTVIFLFFTALIVLLIISLMRINKRISKVLNENKKLSFAVEQSSAAVVITDNHARIQYVNKAFTDHTGYKLHEVLGQNPKLLQSGKTDGNVFKAMRKTLFQKGDPFRCEMINRRKDGTEYTELAVMTPIRNDKNEVTHYLAIKEDISARKKIEQELQESQKRLQTIIEINPECIQIVDKKGKLQHINPAGLKMIEADSVEQVLNRSPLPFVLPEYREKVKMAHQQVINGEIANLEFEMIGLKGTKRWMESHSVPMSDNGNIVRLCVTRDITERKNYEAMIKQLAFFDALTGLPNRRKLLDSLTHSIALSRRENKKLAVFMMDLDKFKAVNDTLGHAAGDDLLKQVAARIPLCLRDSDIVARLGGDEFVIILEYIHSANDAANVATKVIADLTVPFMLTCGEVVQIGASIGISFYPQHGDHPEKLIDCADTALYFAKANGRGRFAYYEKGLSSS